MFGYNEDIGNVEAELKKCLTQTNETFERLKTTYNEQYDQQNATVENLMHINKQLYGTTNEVAQLEVVVAELTREVQLLVHKNKQLLYNNEALKTQLQKHLGDRWGAPPSEPPPGPPPPKIRI